MIPRRAIALAAAWLLLAGSAAAQSSSGGVSHRPWLGVGLGPGLFTGPELDGRNVLLSATFEVPVTRTGGVRISAERIWTAARDYGDASLRQFSADLMMRRIISRNSTCDMEAVVGLGGGLYSFTFDAGPPAGGPRGGYQLHAGADCPGGRLAIGGLFGFRFIDAPDHPAFASDIVVAFSLTLTVRVRF
jgi:hypothetical protein